MKKKIVPDTSVVIDGRITEILKEEAGEYEVIVPEVVVSELESQANLGRETGFEGLAELKSLRQIADESKGRVSLVFYGKAPAEREIKQARKGALDDAIRRVAEENDALLVTSDRIQALVSEAKGLSVRYIGPKLPEKAAPQIFSFFDSQTSSIHLKENTKAYAKKGHVGSMRLEEIAPAQTREDMEEYVKEIVEYAQKDPKSCIEMERRGATVVQLGEYRIVVARPPFSDGLEITAVRPLVKTKLSDYDLSEKLLRRLSERAEGIFIAGAPGHGKSTFAQALAEFYLAKGKIVKTMEQPRDLQVPDVVTQYTELDGSMEKTADVLLLVRPDYTIYDEVRKTADFRIFADMRLAGVGMAGVTHANRPIDAIQRLIGRVELGIIPHVVDTILFIESGQVKEVYELNMTVKVPYGMREADLARPVIEVKDFETGNPRYELYTFGEEVVVMPVRSKGQKRNSSGESEVYVAHTKKLVILRAKGRGGDYLTVTVDGKELFSSKANASGSIKVKRNSEIGRLLSEAVSEGKKIGVL